MVPRSFVLLALFGASTGLAVAQSSSSTTPARSESVTASLVADVTAIAPGQPFTLGIKFDVPSGFYTYYKTPGSSGVPTRVLISAPAGFSVGSPQFPAPNIKLDEVAGKILTTYTYRRSTIVLATVTPPASLRPGMTADFTAQVTYQCCTDAGMCFPPKPQTLRLNLPVGSSAEVRPSNAAAAISATRTSLPTHGSRSKFVKVRAVLNRSQLRPGDDALLGIVIDVEPGHKLQMHRPPIKGLVSTELVLDAIAGIRTAPEANYPPPQMAKQTPGAPPLGEYRGRFVITVPVSAQSSLNGRSVHFSGLLQYQACTEEGICYPPQFASFELDVPIAPANAKVSHANPDVFENTLH